MRLKVTSMLLTCALLTTAPWRARAQGSFQNLDFESGVFVPIPGQLNTVQWGPAMPGWTGYIGSSPINWILHNDLFLSLAGIAIWGPDNPLPDTLHGHYYVVLQNSYPIPTVTPAIAQTGTIPAAAQSLLFYTRRSVPTIGLLFAGQQLGVNLLGGDSSTHYVWGADIGAFAGRTGELRFFGEGYLDYIQFSDQPLVVPEPSSFVLFGAGGLALVWRFRRQRP